MAKSGKKASAPGCWFSKLTTSELSALLKACGAPSSGVKADLIARLRGHPAAAEYGALARAPVLSRSTCEFVGGRDGLSVDDIKDRCRHRGLKVTGTRLQLVVSLLSTPSGGAPAAPRAPRAPSKKPADTERLVARLRAKMEAQPTAWKKHAIMVVTDITSMLLKEADEKGRMEACDPTLADATLALLTELHSGWHAVAGQGYISEYVGDFAWAVGKVVNHEGLRAATPPETRAALLHVCHRLSAQFSDYGIRFGLGDDDDDDDELY